MALITVRQATLADKPALFAFLREAYPGRWQYKFPERWEWQFVHNPFRGPAGLPIWIALDEATGAVVGQSCALHEPLQLGAQIHRLAWGVDFHVLPAYRGQGLGTRLQAANHAAHALFMSLSMAEAAQRIKKSLGMNNLTPVPVYTRIIFHDPDSVLATLEKKPGLLKEVARPLQAHRWLARLLSGRESWRDRAARGRLDPTLTLTEVERFDEQATALWERIGPRFQAAIRRDAAFLDWKYVAQPHVGYTRLLAHREGQLVGWLVYRRARPPERNAGILADLLAAPEDTAALHTLILTALEQLRAQNVTYVTAASSVPAYQEALRLAGFKQTKVARPVVEAPFPVPQAGWLLAKADHDWDQFPLA